MAKTKYSHKIDRVMISNRWLVPAYSRSADWTYLGVGQRYFSPKEYEAMAIEYYPKESQLIDDHNIYWLWIFQDGLIPTKL